MSNLTLSITTIGDLLLRQKITNGDKPIEDVSLNIPIYQKISRDEGNIYMGLIESWHRGSSDMIIDEYVGVNMGFQIPLLIIDRRSCLHILEPVGSHT